ncbi:phasin family protein [Sphingomicrobium lutaoense]|uniref:Phasin family protein n=1 Tax=Sphingomicrobium lutaoense TaxID=515949 RepID=A0A839Z0D7_9SPHN|nr:phasin family protein [Sphingomicrobium lutaoense]MBB3763093.1 phasin family protein [Sphingomicrobium lutaoense]
MSAEKTNGEADTGKVIETQTVATAAPAKAINEEAPVSEATTGAAKKVKKVTKKKKIAGTKAAKTAAASAKKGTDMFNFDSKQWMANFEMPTAEKFEALVAETSRKNEELVRKTQAATEEFAELAKANIEAIVEAGRIAAQGAKTIGSELIEDGREGLEKNAEAVKALTEVKSPTEFFQLQSDWMRSSFDQLVSESSKLTEKLIKLSGDAAQPVTSQASVNAEKVKGMMA